MDLNYSNQNAQMLGIMGNLQQAPQPQVQVQPMQVQPQQMAYQQPQIQPMQAPQVQPMQVQPQPQPQQAPKIIQGILVPIKLKTSNGGFVRSYVVTAITNHEELLPLMNEMANAGWPIDVYYPQQKQGGGSNRGGGYNL